MAAPFILAYDHVISKNVKYNTDRIIELTMKMTNGEIFQITEALLRNKILNYRCLIKLCRKLNDERLLIYLLYKNNMIRLIKIMIREKFINIETVLELFKYVHENYYVDKKYYDLYEETFRKIPDINNKLIRTLQSLIKTECYLDVENIKKLIMYYEFYRRKHPSTVSKKIFNSCCSEFRQKIR